jgi:hypothetical protein
MLYLGSFSFSNFYVSVFYTSNTYNMLSNVNYKYECESCDYKCCNKTNFDKHLLTRKHNDTYNNLQKSGYSCSCGKVYKHRQSLNTHKKSCIPVNPNMSNNDLLALTNMVVELVRNNTDLQKQSLEFQKQSQDFQKQSQEFQKQLLETCKTTNNTIVNNTSNSNNKFNVNVFLDTECKDAMNFEDFVNGIEVSQDDIQNNGRLGFVDGISKIIMDNLNRLSVHQRPIHCTDWKREVLYIKDDNKWTKETDAKKIRDAIQVVSQKSIRTLHAWKMSNPDYKRGSSDFAMECIDMQLHSVAGEKREVYYPKVAKLVAKHVLLDKKNG